MGGLPKPPKIAAKTANRNNLSILEDFIAVKKEGNKLLKVQLDLEKEKLEFDKENLAFKKDELELKKKIRIWN